MGDSDDAQFRAYGSALVDAVEASLSAWVTEVVESRRGGAEIDIEVVIERVREGALPPLRRLVGEDVDRQSTTPLEILRDAARYITTALERAGADAPDGVESSAVQSLGADDPYGVGPMSFAELGPEVADAGLEWGAAKAHVHLRRHQ